MTVWLAIVQVIIGICGPLALFLSLAGKRSGLWIGVLSQPFWIYSSIRSGLWGMFIVSIFYLAVWIYQLSKKRT